MTTGFISRLAPSITDVIRADHTKVAAGYHQYKADSAATQKKALVKSITTLLLVHAKAEEEIFYGVMRAHSPELVEHRHGEHKEMETAARQLQVMDPGMPQYDERLHAVMRSVYHHVAEEESGMLPLAEQIFDEQKLGELGARMIERRFQLMAEFMRPMDRAVQFAKEYPMPIAIGAGLLVLLAAPLVSPRRRAYRRF
jgi:hemerythrin superfamily protein